MNKVICNRLELILYSDVEGIYRDTIQLKSNKNFSILPLENIEYSGQSETTDAGTVLNETVTAKVRYSSDLNFLSNGLKYYVLKLYTDNGSFFVGSPEYPVVLTYRTDNVYVNLTFKASKPQ